MNRRSIIISILAIIGVGLGIGFAIIRYTQQVPQPVSIEPEEIEVKPTKVKESRRKKAPKRILPKEGISEKVGSEDPWDEFEANLDRVIESEKDNREIQKAIKETTGGLDKRIENLEEYIKQNPKAENKQLLLKDLKQMREILLRKK